METQTAKLNNLHIAPRKTRQITNLLKGLSANEAEAQLLIHPQRVSRDILGLLRSAKANAVHNKRMSADRLVIESIRVDEGPTLKRFLPRAMGRATTILKRTSHITLVLKEVGKKAAPRFNIISEKPKKNKKAKKKNQEEKSKQLKPQPQAEAKQKEKPKERMGFFRKMFRRKSV